MNWTYKDKEIKTHDDIPENARSMVYVIHYEGGYKYIGMKMLRSTSEKPALLNDKKRPNHIRFQNRNVKGKRVKREIVGINKPFANYKGSSDNTSGFVISKKEILMFTETNKQSRYWETFFLFKHHALSDDMFLNKNIAGNYWENDDKFIKEF